MRNRFTSGMITGSIIGASMGMLAFSRMNSGQRKALMKNSSKVLKNAAHFLDDITIFKALK